MSEPQATRDPVTEFLSVLGAELVWEPSELSARRHAKHAAATARSRQVRRRGLAIRSGAVAAATVLLVSTSGVALAGGLPRPVQTAVADAARMLPVPLPIPYPAPPPLVELPQEETPRQDLASDAGTMVEKGADGSQAASNSNSSTLESDGGDAISGDGWIPSETGETDSRFDRTDTHRHQDDGSVAGNGLRDDPNNEQTRGWDDWRDSDRWGDGPQGRRQGNDRDRSRNDDRGW